MLISGINAQLQVVEPPFFVKTRGTTESAYFCTIRRYS